MYKLHIYRTDGTRWEDHDCDEEFPPTGHDQGIQDTIWMALRDPEVGEVRVIKVA